MELLRTDTPMTYSLASHSTQQSISFHLGAVLKVVRLLLNTCSTSSLVPRLSLGTRLQHLSKDMFVYMGLVSILMLIGYNAPSLTTVPPAPSNVMVAYVSDTTIRVSWEPLSLVEAKGHITYYVMVTPTTGSRRRRQAIQGERVCTLSSPCEVPANESSVIVVVLDRDTSYSVTVYAVNSEGEGGPTSMPITARC